MIRDQYCFNLIAIESRIQGDHKELKFFLQKCLISSRFNQKMSLQEGRTSIYRKIIAKKGAVRFSERTLDGCDRTKSVGHDHTTRIPLLQDFVRSIFIRVSLRGNISLLDSLLVRLNHDRRISLERSTVIKLTHALMAIWWTEIYQINARRFARSHRTHHAMPGRL